MIYMHSSITNHHTNHHTNRHTNHHTNRNQASFGFGGKLVSFNNQLPAGAQSASSDPRKPAPGPGRLRMSQVRPRVVTARGVGE